MPAPEAPWACSSSVIRYVCQTIAPVLGSSNNGTAKGFLTRTLIGRDANHHLTADQNWRSKNSRTRVRIWLNGPRFTAIHSVQPVDISSLVSKDHHLIGHESTVGNRTTHVRLPNDRFRTPQRIERTAGVAYVHYSVDHGRGAVDISRGRKNPFYL